MHYKGLKWPVFIPYVILVMDECFFAKSLKLMFLYYLLFKIVFKYVVFDFHTSFCLLFIPYFINKHSFCIST